MRYRVPQPFWCATRAFLPLCVFASAAFAIDGTILNQTTGKPQAGVIIQLVQPGQGGMQSLGTTKSDAQGKFRFDQNAQGPTLIQAVYQGVLYNKMIIPGAPSSDIEVPVYNSSTRSSARISQHFIVFQPTASELNVSESFLYQGDAKITFNDPANGTLHFYLPSEAKNPHVVIQGPGGMPIQRTAQTTKQPNVYKVDYPVKPGETRFDVNYSVPSANPMVFSSKLIQKEENTDLVAPSGVTLKGENIESIGQEPKTQATIYRVKGDGIQVEIQGVGALQGSEASSSAASDEDSGVPTVQVVAPRIYDRMYWILGLAFAILGLGSFLLLRAGAASKS